MRDVQHKREIYLELAEILEVKPLKFTSTIDRNTDITQSANVGSTPTFRSIEYELL